MSRYLTQGAMAGMVLGALMILAGLTPRLLNAVDRLRRRGGAR